MTNIFTIDEVRRAVRELAVAKGRDLALAVLVEHGARSVPTLDPKYYDKVHRGCMELLR